MNTEWKFAYVTGTLFFLLLLDFELFNVTYLFCFVLMYSV
jgi:hypothetical protein